MLNMMYAICHKCGEVFNDSKCPICNTRPVTKSTNDLNNNACMAVRYGYQYRKIAQENISEKNGRLHYHLGEPNEILSFLAGAILSGITWDIIKIGAKKVYEIIRSRGKYKKKREDSDVYEILNNDSKLLEFYEYIIEYQDGFIHIEEEEYKYIEEEMMADFVAEETAKVGIENIVKYHRQIYFAASQKIQIISHRQGISKE